MNLDEARRRSQKRRFSNPADFEKSWLSQNNNKVNLEKNNPSKIIHDVSTAISTPPRIKSPSLEVTTPCTLPWSPSQRSQHSRSPFSTSSLHFGQSPGPDDIPLDSLIRIDGDNSEVESVTASNDDIEYGENFRGESGYVGNRYLKNGSIEDSSKRLESVDNFDDATQFNRNGLISDSSDEDITVHELLESSVDVTNEYYEGVDDERQTKNDEVTEILENDIQKEIKVVSMDCELLEEESMDGERQEADDFEVASDIGCQTENDVIILDEISNDLKKGRDKFKDVQNEYVMAEVHETNMSIVEMSDIDVCGKSEKNLASSDAKLQRN